MGSVTSLLAFEEGYRAKPYYDSRGFPTAGIGQLLGPKGTPLSAYTFTVPRVVADLWVRCHLDEIAEALDQNPATRAAWRRLLAAATVGPYNDARCAVYLSMAYQMGVEGLAKFVTTNGLIAVADWHNASEQMLKSAWAKQTSNRADRHAKQFKTGIWDKEYA